MVGDIGLAGIFLERVIDGLGSDSRQVGWLFVYVPHDMDIFAEMPQFAGSLLSQFLVFVRNKFLPEFFDELSFLFVVVDVEQFNDRVIIDPVSYDALLFGEGPFLEARPFFHSHFLFLIFLKFLLCVLN